MQTETATKDMPLSRAKSRAKVKLRGGLVDQAVHHLGNYLTVITTMSQAAVANARPENRDGVRASFFHLFVEVTTTMGALSEALNPEGNADLERKLEELKTSPEYLAVKAQIDEKRRESIYQFGKAIRVDSALHPLEEAYEVALTIPCEHFGDWLLGKICSINSMPYLCLAVEYAPLKPPFKAGDHVALVVRPVLADGTVAPPPEGSDAQGNPAPGQDGRAGAACPVVAAQGGHPGPAAGRAADDAHRDGPSGDST